MLFSQSMKQGCYLLPMPSQELGLGGLSPETAINALDKGKMRQAWQAAKLSQPNFKITNDPAQVPMLADEIGYPLIIKPTMNWGSRGISRVETEAALQWAIDFAATHQRDGNIIVEQMYRWHGNDD